MPRPSFITAPTSYPVSNAVMPQQYRSFLMMTAADEDEVDDNAKTIDSIWKIAALKKEVARLVMRSHKKLGKVNTKLTRARELVEQLLTDPSATQQQLEQCPNVDAIELELKELRERLTKLNELEDLLGPVKNKSGVLPEDVATLALNLGVNDEPPPKQERGPPKKKGPRESKRVPYRRYYSADKTEIRVSTVSHYYGEALFLNAV